MSFAVIIPYTASRGSLLLSLELFLRSEPHVSCLESRAISLPIHVSSLSFSSKGHIFM